MKAGKAQKTNRGCSKVRISVAALDRWLLALVVIAAGLVVTLWALGMVTAHSAPDTVGYFDSASGDTWGSPRNPLYGFAARLLGAGPDTGGIVGACQVSLLLAAVFLLYFGAQAGGIGRAGAFFLAVAGLLSQSGLFHVRLLLPETPAISMLMIAFAGVLAASHERAAFFALRRANRLGYRGCLFAAAKFFAGDFCHPTFVDGVRHSK
jgi:hypothetical protein